MGQVVPLGAGTADSPLMAAVDGPPAQLFFPERASQTAMGRVRERAYARLVSLEAAAHGGASAGHGRDRQALDVTAARGKGKLRAGEAARQSGMGFEELSVARARAVEGVDVRSDEGHDFQEARLALRRAYAAQKLAASRSRSASAAAGSRPAGRGRFGRQRGRGVWLFAAGLGACSLVLAYGLTLQLVLQRESVSSRPVSNVAALAVPVSTKRPEQEARCAGCASVVPDKASAADVPSTRPSTNQPSTNQSSAHQSHDTRRRAQRPPRR